MVEITIINNQAKIKTNDLEIYIEGSFEIKKTGAEAPIVSITSE